MEFRGGKRRYFLHIRQPSSWPMFATEMVRKRPLTLEDYESWAYKLCAGAGEQPCWSEGELVPRAFSRDRLFLHFFSGRRCPGDLQYFLEKFQKDGAVLHVVSLDVIIDEKLGELSSPSAALLAACNGVQMGGGHASGPPVQYMVEGQGQPNSWSAPTTSASTGFFSFLGDAV